MSEAITKALQLPSQVEAVRAQFEEWAKGQGYLLRFEDRGRMRTYFCDDTEHAWRGCCYSALSQPAPSPQPAVPMTPEQMRKAAMDEMSKIPALENHHSWKGWPGTWALATAAVNGITAKAEGGAKP